MITLRDKAKMDQIWICIVTLAASICAYSASTPTQQSMHLVGVADRADTYENLNDRRKLQKKVSPSPLQVTKSSSHD